jgi:hypothetical protein
LIVKKLLLFLFVSIGINTAAEDDLTEYMDNGLPNHYQLLDGKTPIYIEFTDVIQDQYMVDVEWFPNWGIVPMFNGPANINFKLIDRDVKFTIKTDFFNIGNRMFSFPKYRMNADTIAKKEVIKMKFSDIANTPFAFGDMNFDGIKELVIANRRQGQRHHDAYEVYLIQEIEDTSYFNILDLTDVLPYSNIDATTEFDSDNKTIQLYYSGGACSSSYETYKRVFSAYPLRDYKFELIRKIEYEAWDENGDDIPCTKYVYDILDGKKILDEARSGPED